MDRETLMSEWRGHTNTADLLETIKDVVKTFMANINYQQEKNTYWLDLLEENSSGNCILLALMTKIKGKNIIKGCIKTYYKYLEV